LPALFRTDETIFRALAVSATTAAAILALSLINGEGAGPAVTAANNPAAAVAWAQANCYSGLVLKTSAARTEADILLDVAADFESERTRRGIKLACDDALRLGKAAIDPSSLPKNTGEPALFDTPDVAAAN
jgi:hypothetical protein